MLENGVTFEQLSAQWGLSLSSLGQLCWDELRNLFIGVSGPSIAGDSAVGLQGPNDSAHIHSGGGS